MVQGAEAAQEREEEEALMEKLCGVDGWAWQSVTCAAYVTGLAINGL